MFSRNKTFELPALLVKSYFLHPGRFGFALPVTPPPSSLSDLVNYGLGRKLEIGRLLVGRAFVAKNRVKTTAVIEPLDVIKNALSNMNAGRVLLMETQLLFEQPKKRSIGALPQQSPFHLMLQRIPCLPSNDSKSILAYRESRSE